MTREDALQAMIDGNIIRHRYFGDDEYIYMKGQFIFTEEGYNMWSVHDEFWQSRKGGAWEDGWEICGNLTKEVTNPNNDDDDQLPSTFTIGMF